MRKILAALFMLVSISNADIGKDKYKHIVVTAIVSSIATYYSYNHGYSKTESMIIGVTTALLVGLVKEAIDSRKGGSGFSGSDMIADGIGGVIGVIPIIVLKF